MIPEPAQFPLETIEMRIESGEIKIPQFQRDFVWNLKDTAELFDSIIKGYPIGTFNRKDEDLKRDRRYSSSSGCAWNNDTVSA